MVVKINRRSIEQDAIQRFVEHAGNVLEDSLTISDGKREWGKAFMRHVIHTWNQKQQEAA